MTTLNGLPRTWDSFIQGICARKKLVKFNILWEECSQEEAWIVAQEEKMGSEDQALIVHSKKTKIISHHSRGNHFSKNKSRKDMSRIKCYTCDEVGQFARDCPKRQNKKKSNKRRHHAHAPEYDEPSKREPDMKVKTLLVNKNMS